jgi:hypothetical protein
VWNLQVRLDRFGERGASEEPYDPAAPVVWVRGLASMGSVVVRRKGQQGKGSAALPTR